MYEQEVKKRREDKETEWLLELKRREVAELADEPVFYDEWTDVRLTAELEYGMDAEISSS